MNYKSRMNGKCLPQRLRPLMPLSSYINDLPPLTPGHVLVWGLISETNTTIDSLHFLVF